MKNWTPRLQREAALEKVNALLAVSPEAIDILFERACLLDELGSQEEAKTAYLDVLAKDPTHWSALNNLGNLVYALGFTSAARTLYVQAVTFHPDKPDGHVNLANLLAKQDEPELAMHHYETALRLDADHREASRGLAYLFTKLRDEERAAIYRQKAFEHHPILELPYYGDVLPIPLLLLASASGGMVPLNHHIDDHIFLISVLFVEFYDHSTPLPPHQLVVNAIGDADLCQVALEVAIKIVAKTTAPVINHPARVILTGRAENARRLANLQDVIAPKMSLLPRTLLENADAPTLLAQQGFVFPLLLRAPGFHTGHNFIRVESEQEFAASLPSLPGQELLCIEYMDTRSTDGKIRKYRVMVIDGVLYPLHAAISWDWKIHYFTAEMADNPEHRAEDEAFLQDMPGALGSVTMEALERICQTLGLDYGGIDFSINAKGQILLFEANATMVVYPPDKDTRWDYRRPAVERIIHAIRRTLMQNVHTTI